jgi:hypothetical protein
MGQAMPQKNLRNPRKTLGNSAFTGAAVGGRLPGRVGVCRWPEQDPRLPCRPGGLGHRSAHAAHAAHRRAACQVLSMHLCVYLFSATL